MLTSQPSAVSAKRCAGTLVALLCCLGPQSSVAQEAGAVTVDVGRCIELESADDRLACFGSEVNAVLEQREPAAADAPGATTDGAAANVAASGADARAAHEGRAGARAPEDDAVEARAAGVAETARDPEHDATEARAAGAAAAAREEYSGTIVEFYERLPNAYVITLDNGQVWLQTEPEQYPLRPGLEVRIYSTAWGESYRLHGLGTGGHIQVRRVR